jgi:ketosteroid isomerase-like protein/uncharacterized protein YndB with AHSA1/START domain
MSVTSADNKQLMQNAFEYLARGDGRPFADLMADDFTWTLTGKTAWSREYAGKEAVTEQLLRPLFAQFADRYRNTAQRFIAEGDWVVVQCRGSVETRRGQRYDNEYCYVCRFSGGRLVELTEYLDTELVATVLDPPPDRRVVSASREIAAGPGRIFELIADPAVQPRWDGNENLARAAAGQRVRRTGDAFLMTLTRDGAVRENHVVEFEEGRLIAWMPSEVGQARPGHRWRWELEPAGPSRTLVTHTYDWTQLTDEGRHPRARATTAVKLQASLDRLAALAEQALSHQLGKDLRDLADEVVAVGAGEGPQVLPVPARRTFARSRRRGRRQRRYLGAESWVKEEREG